MANKVRLTMAQALVRYLGAQRTEIGGSEVPLVNGIFAIFGHGNVAGLGEAMEDLREFVTNAVAEMDTIEEPRIEPVGHPLLTPRAAGSDPSRPPAGADGRPVRWCSDGW